VNDSPKIVALGGGTGLSELLRGLKRMTAHLTAIVAVSDDGGSSGRLRAELGMLAPGDIRDCLVALADDESLMGDLFAYRFQTGELAGHALGNLFLAALTAVTGDFDLAVKESSRVLKIRGTVLPSTTTDVKLAARLEDGRVVRGQSTIGHSSAPIERVWLEPSEAEALPLALEKVARADLVVLGPGSLFTSVLPPLLVPRLREAIAETRARVVYVCNLMTQPGETTSFEALDHLRALQAHVGEGLVDVMLVNSAPLPAGVTDCYAAEGARPVRWRGDPAGAEPVEVRPVPLVAPSGRQARHDPALLARALVELAVGEVGPRATGRA
jgi:uncharacterized cofD-like protein